MRSGIEVFFKITRDMPSASLGNLIAVHARQMAGRRAHTDFSNISVNFTITRAIQYYFYIVLLLTTQQCLVNSAMPAGRAQKTEPGLIVASCGCGQPHR